MVMGLDVLMVTGMLTLAGNNVTCEAQDTAHIHINPVTKSIAYDFEKTSAELGRMKSDSINPYAPGTDTATGGLRHDSPRTTTQVTLGTLQYADRDLVCFWYKDISITIELQPKIYIAKERASSQTKICRRAILNHEINHVKVDRFVINQYSKEIGKVIELAVDELGAVGPYRRRDISAVQEKMSLYIQKAIKSKEKALHNEMRRRQARVDSLSEYERVSKICNAEEKDLQTK